MKLALWLSILSCALIQPADPPQPLPQPTPLHDRLAALEQKFAAVKDVRADFEQHKKTAMLKKPMVSKGRLAGQEDVVLWETREPRESTMRVTAKEVQILYPHDRLLEIYTLDARFAETAGGPIPRLSTLAHRFEISELPPRDLGAPADDQGLLALHLAPKAPEVKRHIQSVRVLLDESIPAATRIIITDPDGDQTEIQFTNIRINTDITDADLHLERPEGTRISRPQSDHEQPADKAQPPRPLDESGTIR
jgi:outer membrane lipoprotein-sorting protein